MSHEKAHSLPFANTFLVTLEMQCHFLKKHFKYPITKGCTAVHGINHRRWHGHQFWLGLEKVLVPLEKICQIICRFTVVTKAFNTKTSMGPPSQELEQAVCQKYGWSIEYTYSDGGTWLVEIRTSLSNGSRVFSSQTRSGKKEGKQEVSAIALQGLQEDILREESKPVRELVQIFPDPIRIFDSSSSEVWDRFWNETPKAVGIDVEGNQISPPVLIQVSTNDFTIIEVPSKNGLSPNLKKLLEDDTIVKAFCDNFSHRDKKSLGLLSSTTNYNFWEPPIVDLEQVIANIMGRSKVPRGLSKIISLCMPELNARIGKPKTSGYKTTGRFRRIGRFAMIEQGKAKSLQSLADLSSAEQQYAALDSWCTLQAYQRLQDTELL